MKWTLLDFSFSLSKKAELWRMTVGKPRMFFFLHLSVGSASLKKFKLCGWPIVVLLYSLGHQFFDIELQYMLTLTCMQYVCFSIIHQTMTRSIGSIMCLHDLLMHV